MQTFPEIYDIYKKNIPSKENGYVQISFRDSPAWKDFVHGKMADTPEARKLNEELKQRPRKVTSEEERIIWEIAPQSEVPALKVKVVGVWDTVGALGVPDGRWTNNSGSRAGYGFHNVKLNNCKE
jgi:hypothetical protein